MGEPRPGSDLADDGPNRPLGDFLFGRARELDHAHVERRFGGEGVLVLRRGPFQGRPDAQRLGQPVEPLGPGGLHRLLDELSRPARQQVARLLGRPRVRGELLQLVQEPAHLRIRPGVEGLGDLGRVDGRHLLGEVGEVGPPGRKLSEEAEPALAVVLHQGLRAFVEKELVDVVIDPRPGGVARLGGEVVLEGTSKLLVALVLLPPGQQDVLVIFDLGDVPAGELEVSEVARGQVDRENIGRVVLLDLDRLPRLDLLAGHAHGRLDLRLLLGLVLGRGDRRRQGPGRQRLDHQCRGLGIRERDLVERRRLQEVDLLVRRPPLPESDPRR